MKFENNQFLDICNSLLKKKIQVSFKVCGFSMFPILKSGDLVQVSSIGLDKVSCGDIVLCKTEDEKIVVHRIYKKTLDQGKYLFKLKGDFNQQGYEDVFFSGIYGLVLKIERNKKIIYIKNCKTDLLAKIKVYSYFGLKILRPALSKIIRFLQGSKIYKKTANFFYRDKTHYQWITQDQDVYELYIYSKENIIAKVALKNSTNLDDLYSGFWIFGMWVNWPFRHLGIGTRMLGLVCEFSKKKGAQAIKLLVFKDNKPARDLYLKSGFRECSIKIIDDFLEEEYRKSKRRRVILSKKIS